MDKPTFKAIHVLGYPDELVCAKNCHEHGCSSCSSDAESHARTDLMVAEFAKLLAASEFSGRTVEFVDAGTDRIDDFPDIKKLLDMAKLSPVVAIDGKPFFLGGFSPVGMMEELRKRFRA